MEKLIDVTDNGTKIIEKLYKREEVLWGQCSDRAPDIFIVPRVGYGISTHLNANLFDKLQNHGVMISGSHRLEGIFAGCGPDIKKGFDLNSELHVWDVASTLLHMHHLAIPSYMDGKVIKEMYHDNSDLAKIAIAKEVAGEGQRIKEKLRTLSKTKAKALT
jgi:predicted AlkP superfamily phosphohydrolase/phosphomutase